MLDNSEFRDDQAYDEFVAWVGQQPPETTYDYVSNGNCAYAQFLKATGRAANPCVGSSDWRDGIDGENQPIDNRLDGCLFISNRPPLLAGTFGGILERLK